MKYKVYDCRTKEYLGDIESETKPNSDEIIEPKVTGRVVADAPKPYFKDKEDNIVFVWRD